MNKRMLCVLLTGLFVAQISAGCARYSTTRQVLPARLVYYDPDAPYDAKYVRTVRKTLTGLDMLGFRVSKVDAGEYIRNVLSENPNYYVANLQVTHGCFNDYGIVLTWVFTVPIAKVQFDVMEVSP